MALWKYWQHKSHIKRDWYSRAWARYFIMSVADGSCYMGNDNYNVFPVVEIYLISENDIHLPCNGPATVYIIDDYITQDAWNACQCCYFILTASNLYWCLKIRIIICYVGKEEIPVSTMWRFYIIQCKSLFLNIFIKISFCRSWRSV